MRVFGDAGDELTFDAYGATVERLATIIEEGEVLRALDAAGGFQPTIKRIASQFASIHIAPEVLNVELEEGRSLSSRLVVGADGANSSVRAAAGVSASIKSYEQTAVVANFECARPHLNTAWQWFTDEGVVALLPLPGDRVSLVWSAPTALANELTALNAGQLATRVTERSAAVLGTLAAIGKAHTFPLRRLTVSSLIASRIALIGDAAHVIHPLAGQGLNLGLQDVALLLDVVRTREPFRDIGDIALLRRYERGRAEAIRLMRFATDSLARLFAFDDPLARRLRNVGMAAVNRVGPLKNALIRQALG
jgi:ubiquinone biosynthesis UbiH/UbiF/VisC/COQ6 family hydroxylase